MSRFQIPHLDSFRAFISRNQRAVVTLLLSLICLGLFAQLADEVLERETEQLDKSVLTALRHPDNIQLPVGPAWFTKVAIDISCLGDATVLTLVTVTTLGFLLLARRYRYFLAVLLSVPSGAFIMMLLKALIQRERPDVVPHLVVVSHESFPSGHSMISAIVYLTLGGLIVKAISQRRLRIYVLACFVLLTVAIGLSRIYLGVHYPTDVAAGWLAGIAYATFFNGLISLIFARFRKKPISDEQLPQADRTPATNSGSKH